MARETGQTARASCSEGYCYSAVDATREPEQSLMQRTSPMVPNEAVDLNGIDAFLIDLDGVLYTGATPIPGGAETLTLLDQLGYRVVFLSNTTQRSRGSVQAKLQSMGITVDRSSIFTPPVAAVAMIEEQGGGRCRLFTTGDVHHDFVSPAIEIASSGRVDYVVIGDAGDRWTTALLTDAFRCVQDGARLLALEKDRYWMGSDGICLSAGPFVAAIEYATSTTATVLGKPSFQYFHRALQTLGVSPERAAMIGDDITTDIGGGQQAGLKGILVRTGKYSEEAVQRSGIIPDLLIDSLASLQTMLRRG